MTKEQAKPEVRALASWIWRHPELLLLATGIALLAITLGLPQ